MKPSFLILVCFLSCCISFSQSKRIDSLKYELAIATSDTSRVLKMAFLANLLGGIDSDSALYYGEKAMALARKIKFPTGEIRASTFTSVVLVTTGNLPKALSMAFVALQIAEKNKLDKEKKWPFITIANVYRALKDFPNAISFRKKALQIAEAYHDTTSMNIENTIVGSMYFEANQFDSASFFLNRALVLSKKGKVRSSIYNGLGDIEAKKGDPVHAMEYYQKVLHIIDTNNHSSLSQIYMSLANLYKKENKRDSGIYYAERAVAEAQSIYLKKDIIEASILLSELYEPVNTKESYRYYKLATTTKESLFGAGDIQSLQIMIAQEEERQNEAKRAKAAFQNQLKQYALFTVLAVFLLLAFIFYRNNKKQKEANTLLRQQKEEIQITLTQLRSTQSQLIQSEKMASLGELTAGIAHEIQNPLNFVNNFSEVNTELIDELIEERNKEVRDFKNEDELLKDIKENEKKINHHGKRAGNIVKGMLLHSQSSSGKKEPTDINTLADEYLRLSYHARLNDRAGQGLQGKDASYNVQMVTDLDPAVGMMEVIPQDIGRVFLNIINNAFYAVAARKEQEPEGFEPTVSIFSKRTANGVEFRIRDNGTGIPNDVKARIFEPFFTTKPTGQGTGLGLSLAYDIVTKGHGGKLEVESVEGVGQPYGQAVTEFLIFLPVK